MKTRRILAAILLVAGNSSEAQMIDQPPVSQVDHLMVRTHKPEILHRFFSEILQLPVAWPLTKYRVFTTGGVGFGNVNVEFIGNEALAGDPSRSQFVGIALEPPSLKESLAELSTRGIQFGQLRPGPVGSSTVQWTNVTLNQLSDADNFADANIFVFLNKYEASYVDVPGRRARLLEELRLKRGGALGIEAVRQIIIGTVNLERARKLWGALLAPRLSEGSDTWAVGAGPAVRLVSADRDAIQSLVLQVSSVEQAQSFLRDNDLIGSVSEQSVTIDPEKVQGLIIRLVE
jgi:hypothetical protein